MKTDNFFTAIAVAVMCFVSVSCKKEVVEVQEPDFYDVTLGMAGEILEVTEEPLRRANGETDLYGFQVYSTPNKQLAEGENAVWTKYAYGLFASDDNIVIKLIKGYKYKFVATMVVDGQNRILSYGSGYYSPFFVSGTNSDVLSVGDKFNYQSADYLNGLGNGSTYLNTPNGSFNHPNVERFYGELEDYVPGLNSKKAMIKMKRTSFGAKFIAKGKLAKEGTLEVQMTEAPKMLLDLTVSDKSISDIFTFKNVAQAYRDNNHKEDIAVTLNWHKDDGTVFPLGTHTITFKRNKTSVVQITIDNEQAEGELGVEIDDVDMSEDADITNIEDGTIVDTDVDTNA